MKAIFATILVFLGMHLQAQIEKDSSLTKIQLNNDIDRFILTVKNKKHKELLMEFAKDRDSLTQITIHRETNKLYEIWVDYSTRDGYNWGEGYTLDKHDGKIEMIWHEQPFQSQLILLDSLPHKGKK